MLSTLTDLFNVRIGAAKKSVFLCREKDSFWLLRASGKLPLKEGLEVSRIDGDSVEEVLSETGVEKESIYYLLPPGLYFRNRITLPFTDTQKIEGIIRYEVKEYLPNPDGDYLTDFYSADAEVCSFTTEREQIRSFYEALGRFRDNLRAVIPLDTALLNAMGSLVDDESYVLMDIGPSAIYIQYVDGLKIVAAVRVVNEGNGDTESSRELFVRELQSQLIMVLKTAHRSFVYLNVRSDAAEGGELVRNLLKEMDVSYQDVPYFSYERSMRVNARVNARGSGRDSGAVIAADLLPLMGMVREQGGEGARVNLLKDEFRPRMKGYVSVREFSIVGGLLLVLLILATSGLVLDIHMRKRQISLLRERMRALSSEVYDDPAVSLEQSKDKVREIEEALVSLKSKTDARFSSLQLLKELSLYIPGDVVMEYSDLIIERDHIKFSGKARTFSDIDRIRKELLLSEYFSDVNVTNTGTTGSTEGFTVTFVFDIDVVEELQGGN